MVAFNESPTALTVEGLEVEPANFAGERTAGAPNRIDLEFPQPRITLADPVQEHQEAALASGYLSVVVIECFSDAHNYLRRRV